MKVMLDSGAYTAWRQEIEIPLASYIDYIKRNEPLLDCYVNLDVIPGTHGRREWQSSSIEAAAKLSYQNQQRMKDAGLRPIPVFHQDEGMHWLERYVSDGESYIALSPYKRDDRASATRWLDRCFDFLSSTGQPLVRTHAMGLTAPDACFRYPWTSADSSRWALAAGYGQVPVPLHVGGRWDYSTYDVFSMTDRSTHVGRHIDTLDGLDLDRARRFLTDEVPIDLAEARYSPAHRQRAWVRYFLNLANGCRENASSPLLLHRSHNSRTAGRQFDIVFVTDTTRQFYDVLTECGAQRVLLSFAKLKDRKVDVLENYVSGRVSNSKPRAPKMDMSNDTYLSWRRLMLHRRNRANEIPMRDEHHERC